MTPDEAAMVLAAPWGLNPPERLHAAAGVLLAERETLLRRLAESAPGDRCGRCGQVDPGRECVGCGLRTEPVLRTDPLKGWQLAEQPPERPGYTWVRDAHYGPTEAVLGCWTGRGWRTVNDDLRWDDDCLVTHWRPLEAPAVPDVVAGYDPPDDEDDARQCGICHPAPGSDSANLCPPHRAQFEAWKADEQAAGRG